MSIMVEKMVWLELELELELGLELGLVLQIAKHWT